MNQLPTGPAVATLKSLVAPATVHVALVGNPNTGKSTLFSALCGIPTRIGNYPGVTVEEKFGHYADGAGEVVVIDLPGTYSLSARTPDEFVSVDVLLGRRGQESLDAVVVIVDATNLERNLYLFTQVRQLGLPIVLVLNMWDRVEPGEMQLDVAALAQRLGVQVVTASASRHEGIGEIKRAVRRALTDPKPSSVEFMPSEFIEQCNELSRWIAAQHDKPVANFIVERMLLDVDGQAEREYAKLPQLIGLTEQLQEARERLAT